MMVLQYRFKLMMASFYSLLDSEVAAHLYLLYIYFLTCGDDLSLSANRCISGLLRGVSNINKAAKYSWMILIINIYVTCSVLIARADFVEMISNYVGFENN